MRTMACTLAVGPLPVPTALSVVHALVRRHANWAESGPEKNVRPITFCGPGVAAKNYGDFISEKLARKVWFFAWC